MILILRESSEIAQNFGYGSALRTLFKGLDVIGEPYTLDEKEDFDVIVANDYTCAKKGIQLKKKTGKPLIASVHLPQTCLDGEKELMEECDGVIVYSELMRDFIKKTYTLSVPIEVVQLGIDADFWNYIGTPKEDFLLFVGRAKSGNKNFIEVMWKALQKKIPLRVAGDLDTEIPNVNVKYLSQEDLAKWYQKARLHILPSTFEPFGLVTLEAMACGCPVAVSIKAGVAELLNDKVAILFDPEKEFTLTDFMERAKNFDPKTISDFAKQFNHVTHARSFVNAVNRIMQKDSLDEILKEIKRGDYDRFPVKDRIVFDIGAYLGETAIHFSKRGAKKVYAIEPFNSFYCIKDNAEKYKCDNIIPIKAGIGKSDGIVSIDPRFINDGSSRLVQHLQKNGEILPIVTLDTLINALKNEDIVLKIDCEGAEDCLFGVKKETLSKVHYMFIETHEDIRKDIGLDLSMFLTNNGFIVGLESHGKNVGMIYAERNKKEVLNVQ